MQEAEYTMAVAPHTVAEKARLARLRSELPRVSVVPADKGGYFSSKVISPSQSAGGGSVAKERAWSRSNS